MGEYINCCGIGELNGVSNTPPEYVLGDWMSDSQGYEPFVFFSDTAGNKRRKESGWNFARFLVKHKLGKVKKIGTKRNPNSRNMLTMWVFIANKTKLKSWWKRYNEAHSEPREPSWGY